MAIVRNPHTICVAPKHEQQKTSRQENVGFNLPWFYLNPLLPSTPDTRDTRWVMVNVRYPTLLVIVVLIGRYIISVSKRKVIKRGWKKIPSEVMGDRECAPPYPFRHSRINRPLYYIRIKTKGHLVFTPKYMPCTYLQYIPFFPPPISFSRRRNNTINTNIIL